MQKKGQRLPICDDTVRLHIQRYVDAAREKCRDIPEKVYPHLWRHTRANTEAKRKAIEKAIGTGEEDQESSLNYTVDDEELLKQLYGL